jgi:hypothetical protein
MMPTVWWLAAESRAKSEINLHNTVTNQQFCAWIEQYYSSGFHSALNEAHEYARSKHDIPLEFKEKLQRKDV